MAQNLDRYVNGLLVAVGNYFNNFVGNSFNNFVLFLLGIVLSQFYSSKVLKDCFNGLVLVNEFCLVNKVLAQDLEKLFYRLDVIEKLEIAMGNPFQQP
jgi:hypothetical protein